MMTVDLQSAQYPCTSHAQGYNNVAKETKQMGKRPKEILEKQTKDKQACNGARLCACCKASCVGQCFCALINAVEGGTHWGCMDYGGMRLCACCKTSCVWQCLHIEKQVEVCRTGAHEGCTDYGGTGFVCWLQSLLCQVMLCTLKNKQVELDMQEMDMQEMDRLQCWHCVLAIKPL